MKNWFISASSNPNTELFQSTNKANNFPFASRLANIACVELARAEEGGYGHRRRIAGGNYLWPDESNSLESRPNGRVNL